MLNKLFAMFNHISAKTISDEEESPDFSSGRVTSNTVIPEEFLPWMMIRKAISFYCPIKLPMAMHFEETYVHRNSIITEIVSKEHSFFKVTMNFSNYVLLATYDKGNIEITWYDDRLPEDISRAYISKDQLDNCIDIIVPDYSCNVLRAWSPLVNIDVASRKLLGDHFIPTVKDVYYGRKGNGVLIYSVSKYDNNYIIFDVVVRIINDQWAHIDFYKGGNNIIHKLLTCNLIR